jgi:hypothetical protein
MGQFREVGGKTTTSTGPLIFQFRCSIIIHTWFSSMDLQRTSQR